MKAKSAILIKQRKFGELLKKQISRMSFQYIIEKMDFKIKIE